MGERRAEIRQLAPADAVGQGAQRGPPMVKPSSFDVSPAAAPVAAEAVDALDEAAAREVDAMLRDPDQPVVMFAYTWCEFCNAVRKVFSEYGIAYTSIDLNSAAYRQGDRGDKMFKVLKRRTGSVTLPQTFIGGGFKGGCTDVFDKLKSGRLHAHLQEYGVTVDPSVKTDPYEQLPKWLLPR